MGGVVGKLMKGIKEHQGCVEELEEELEAERQARAKAERQRCDLAKEFEELGERLDQAGGATLAQIELNKKRENEINKLRKDYEEANIQQEAVMMSLKKKHQDAIQEMSEQVDQLSKMKSKVDKDKVKIQSEIGDARSAYDEITRAKASAEKSNKVLVNQLNEMNKKVEEANMTLGDYEGIKRKTAAENGDLLRVAGDINNNIMMIQKIKSSLQTNLEEAKNVADNEARERHLLLGKYKNLEHELDGIKENLEDEQRSKEVAREQLLVADRKAHAMTNALEEARSLLEQADKARRNAETELSDVNESLSEATVQNQSIAAAKRKMESEMPTLHADFDEMSAEAQLSEGKAAKAMVDAARLADELRSEQDNAMMTEKQRKVLEAQWKEMQNRLDEAETNALKG